MSIIRDMFGELMISFSSFIYDLTSGWLSGEEDSPKCFLEIDEKNNA